MKTNFGNLNDLAQLSTAKAYNLAESHFHKHYEIYYLISGRRRYIIENRIYDIEAGDIILIPPMTMHKTQRIPGTSEDELHVRLLYNLKEIPDILLPCFKRHFYRPEGSVKATIKQLIEESCNAPEGTDEALFLHTLNAHKMLLLIKDIQNNAAPLQHLSSRDQLIQNAALYIKEHCTEALTLGFVAERLGFSPEYFSSIFKSVMGLSFINYLNNVRIGKAIELLKDTNKPISQISEVCGFNDSNYFTIVFRKAIGIPPRQYRKELAAEIR